MSTVTVEISSYVSYITRNEFPHYIIIYCTYGIIIALSILTCAVFYRYIRRLYHKVAYLSRKVNRPPIFRDPSNSSTLRQSGYLIPLTDLSVSDSDSNSESNSYETVHYERKQYTIDSVEENTSF